MNFESVTEKAEPLADEQLGLLYICVCVCMYSGLLKFSKYLGATSKF
jgi:hypothetical protein